MKWLAHPLTVLAISLVAVIAVVSLRRGQRVGDQSGAQVAQLRQEVDRLNTQHEQLKTELQKAGTPLAQEKMIRDQLLLKKEGEYVVQLTDDPRLREQAVVPAASPTPLEEWKKLVLGE